MPRAPKTQAAPVSEEPVAAEAEQTVAGEAGEYRVVNLGAAYRSEGRRRGFAHHGDLIMLDDSEAQRLLALGAVVPSDQPDPVPGEAGEHAQRLVGLAEHAANVRKQATGQ